MHFFLKWHIGPFITMGFRYYFLFWHIIYRSEWESKYLYIHAYIIYMFTCRYYLCAYYFGPFMGVEIYICICMHILYIWLQVYIIYVCLILAHSWESKYGIKYSGVWWGPKQTLQHSKQKPFDAVLGTVPTICLEHYYYMYRPFAWNIIIICTDHLLGTLLLCVPTICLEHYYYMYRPFAWNIIIMCADHLLGTLLLCVPTICLGHYY